MIEMVMKCNSEITKNQENN